MENLTQSEKIHLGTKEICQRVRGQIKKEFPNCKWSIYKESYSMGSSIHIHLMEADFKVVQDFEDIPEIVKIRYRDEGRRTDEQLKSLQESGHHQLGNFYTDYDGATWSNGVFLTKEGYNLFKKVQEIQGQYNYDNSDPMTDYFDVNFYVHLNLGKWDQKFKQVEKIKTPVKTEVKTVSKIEIRKNTEKNGIEIKFPRKPSFEVIQKLKENGFRWSRYNGLWYKRYSEEAKKEAEKIIEVD